MEFPPTCTPDQCRVLSRLAAEDLAQRQAGSTDPMRLKAIAPTVARLLHLLILQAKARTIAEFGTSFGFSTIHLAAAACHTKGRVWSADNVHEKTAHAQCNITAAGLQSIVELHTANGEQFARSLPGTIDFVLVDFGLHTFKTAWPHVKKRMAPGALLFIDGWPTLEEWDAEADWRDFKASIATAPDFSLMMLPLEKCHLLAVRQPA
jgi:predicted O-methyltransferase YrrM